MLDKARRRLAGRHICNVDFYLCNGRNFDLPAASFDRIVLVTVLGEVAERETYLREFCRLLKPGALLSVSETAGDPDRLPAADIIRLAEAAGLSMRQQYGGRRNFTLNFQKPAAGACR